MILNLVYAIKDGELVHISEVERGLKCGCECPSCSERLIARKGQKMAHHFAHRSATGCEYGYETSLHMAAKEILARVKKMVLPPVYIYHRHYKQTKVIRHAQEIMIDKVELERRFGDVIPDVAVYSGGQVVFVEIYVTHRIGKEKIEKLKELGIPTVEINLSKLEHMVEKEELTDILVNNSELKHWAYSPYKEAYEEGYRAWLAKERQREQEIQEWEKEFAKWENDFHNSLPTQKETKKEEERKFLLSMYSLAEEILSEAGKMMVPPAYAHPGGRWEPIRISEAKEIKVEDMKLEYQEGNEMPSLRVHSGGRFFAIWLYLDKSMDRKEMEKLKKAGASVLEIDISAMGMSMDREQMSAALMKDIKFKYWEHNAYAEKFVQERSGDIGVLHTQPNKYIRYYVECPVSGEVKHVMNQCKNCPHYVDFHYEEGIVLCAGKRIPVPDADVPVF